MRLESKFSLPLLDLQDVFQFLVLFLLSLPHATGTSLCVQALTFGRWRFGVDEMIMR